MREIKFRAWNIGGKIMNYSIAGLYPSEYGIAVQVNGSRDINSINYVLLQYTGLKDKNGKEIYEGDVVKILDTSISKHYDFIGECVWYEFSCGFNLRKGNHDLMFKRLDSTTEQYEIIGNIYENPNLLDDKKNE